MFSFPSHHRILISESSLSSSFVRLYIRLLPLPRVLSISIALTPLSRGGSLSIFIFLSSVLLSPPCAVMSSRRPCPHHCPAAPETDWTDRSNPIRAGTPPGPPPPFRGHVTLQCMRVCACGDVCVGGTSRDKQGMWSGSQVGCAAHRAAMGRRSICARGGLQSALSQRDDHT